MSEDIREVISRNKGEMVFQKPIPLLSFNFLGMEKIDKDGIYFTERKKDKSFVPWEVIPNRTKENILSVIYMDDREINNYINDMIRKKLYYDVDNF